MSQGRNVAAIAACLQSQPGAMGAPLPSAPGVTLFKVMNKMFAVLEDRRVQCVILKCDPHLADILREQYAGVGHRSHLDRRFWISVNLEADVPIAEVERLAARSYELVRDKLTRKLKAELQASDCGTRC